MIVEMNIDWLLKNKITANEFLVLQLLIENQEDRLTKVGKIFGEVENSNILKSLLKMGFVVINATTGKITVTEKALKTFKGKGHFEELYALFPVSVIRPDGKRETLRTAKKQCQTKYNRIAKRKDIHENILKCLKFEIAERTQNDSLKYMQKMPNWLSKETWTEYEEKMKVEEIIGKLEENTYGNELL